MERNFTNENMEEFLRQSADALRMRPSAKVWKGISNHLSRRRRITGFILGTTLLVTSAVGYFMFADSSNNYINKEATKNTKVENVALQPLAANSNNNLIAANSTSTKEIKRSYGGKIAETKEFSFTQTLLQRNAETSQFAYDPTIVDSYFDGIDKIEPKSNVEQQVALSSPPSIESVVNTYRPKAKKLSWQTYFTPTVSYRRLNDSKIDNVAPHKPAFGFELGTTAKYVVSKTTKLRAGLQFNVNRYEIKTFDSYSEMATVRLNDRSGSYSVRAMTNYNNFSGYQSNWLQNFYAQLSAPIGVELKIKGDDKMQFGIASTLQPTYLLGDKTYVISSDYKNYVSMPDLVRRWNVSTSLETFVAYSTGHLNWQVGPQVRYQMLSSYLKKYPVKENLFDFGLKVGISVNK